MTSLSVIIVTYNNEKTIGPCLKSLQQFIPFELESQVILIDNNSQDGTYEVIKSFCAPEKSYITHECIINKYNNYFAHAVNQGIRIARGKYVLVLNPDTVLTAETLPVLMKYLDTHHDTGMVGPLFRWPDGTIQPSCRRFPTYQILIWELTGLSRLIPKHPIFGAWKMGDFDHLSTCPVDQPMGACMMVSSEALKRVGEMDESFPMFFNDVDWCMRFKLSGYKRIFVHNAEIIHSVGHSVNQKRSKMILLSHLSFYTYLQKYYNQWWEKIINVCFNPILLAAAMIRIISWGLVKTGRKLKFTFTGKPSAFV